MILNPVAREANLFVQIYQSIPLSVRNLVAWVIVLIMAVAAFFIVLLIIKFIGFVLDAIPFL